MGKSLRGGDSSQMRLMAACEATELEGSGNMISLYLRNIVSWYHAMMAGVMHAVHYNIPMLAVRWDGLGPDIGLLGPTMKYLNPCQGKLCKSNNDFGLGS